MKALMIRKYGSPSNLKVADVPKPIVQNREVLVKIKAVSINDWDLGIINGKPFVNRVLAGLLRPKTQILGSDISGVIEAVGDKVTKFNVGDKVYGDLSSSKFGGFAEYVSIDEKHLCRMAEGMSFDIAAAIPQAGMLAYQALNDFTDITDGMKILINGAGGGVGTYAVQMLKNHNVHLTAVDEDLKRHMLLDLGYDEFIDYRKKDFTKLGIEYDLIIDCKTSKPNQRYANVLKENGMYVTLGGKLSKVFKIILFSKQLESKYGRKYKAVALKTNRNLPEINKMFEEGQLTSIIDPSYFSLDEGKEAMIYYASGHQLGKVLIKVEDENMSIEM